MGVFQPGAVMTDLELTKLCADWRGIEYSVQKDRYGGEPYVRIEAFPGDANGGCYQPLHNDLQAMDLVKVGRLDIEPQDEQWIVSVWTDNGRRANWSYDESLNRAIVGCIVELQKNAKVPSDRIPECRKCGNTVDVGGGYCPDGLYRHLPK
jgi:hypothetical protein